MPRARLRSSDSDGNISANNLLVESSGKRERISIVPPRKRKKSTPAPPTKLYLSGYEPAWRARRIFLFAKVAKEGKGDLYRTLKIFNRMDQAYDYQATWGYTATGLKLYIDRHAFVPVEKPKRSLKDIFTAGKNVVENDKPRETFEALDYSTLPILWLREVAQEGFDAIVELGAGYGRALFELYFQGGPSKARYIGAEFTRSGQELMAKFLKLAPGLPFETAFFDHQKPDLSFLRKRTKRVLIFTHHSIEQVKTLPENYFSVLADAAPYVVGVHFEPFGFQLVPGSDISKRHAEFIAKKDYNSNFLSTLRAAEGRKVLNVRLLAANVINPQSENPTSIAVWESNKS
ncbi:MAG: hypothetical protein IT564_06085 [Rhodospirillales bacterium]|nr:hypothetical protein [Rhodospirillales bacterium]